MAVWIRFSYFPAGGPDPAGGADPFLPIVIVFFFANILYRNRDDALEHFRAHLELTYKFGLAVVVWASVVM